MVAANSPLLSARDLTCERDYRRLFAPVSIDVAPGDALQLAGPNGMGKTSLIKVLAGLMLPAEGQLSYPGLNNDPRQDLLYIGHRTGLKPELTPLENLRWLAGLRLGKFDTAKAQSALEQLGIGHKQDQPVFQLSAGQQRRVALTRLFLEPARLWLLDEPFTAIDRSGVQLLEERFAQHQQSGGAVLLTTHQPLSMHLSVKALALEPSTEADN